MKLSFPEELSNVNDHISVIKIEEMVSYYKDNDLIFSHNASDKVAFRFIACQLFMTSLVKITEMGKVFKISRTSLIRWIKGYKKEGAKSFYTATKKKAGKRVMRKKIQKRKSKAMNIIGQKSSSNSIIRKVYL